MAPFFFVLVPPIVPRIQLQCTVRHLILWDDLHFRETMYNKIKMALKDLRQETCVSCPVGEPYGTIPFCADKDQRLLRQRAS